MEVPVSVETQLALLPLFSRGRVNLDDEEDDDDVDVDGDNEEEEEEAEEEKEDYAGGVGVARSVLTRLLGGIH